MMMLKSVFSKYARGRGRNFSSRCSESDEDLGSKVAGAVLTALGVACGCRIAKMMRHTEESNKRLKKMEEYIIDQDEKLEKLEEYIVKQEEKEI